MVDIAAACVVGTAVVGAIVKLGRLAFDVYNKWKDRIHKSDDLVEGSDRFDLMVDHADYEGLLEIMSIPEL